MDARERRLDVEWNPSDRDVSSRRTSRNCESRIDCEHLFSEAADDQVTICTSMETKVNERGVGYGVEEVAERSSIERREDGVADVDNEVGLSEHTHQSILKHQTDENSHSDQSTSQS